MSASESNIGIVCPECKGNLKAMDKIRRGVEIERRYDCLNEECPALKCGKRVSVITTESVKRVFYRGNISTCRRKRKNLPANEQKVLSLADIEPSNATGMDQS